MVAAAVLADAPYARHRNAVNLQGLCEEAVVLILYADLKENDPQRDWQY